MADFEFEVVEDIAVLNTPNDKGWATHLAKVKWNGRAACYDIRQWNEDMTKCGKGKTFTMEELGNLYTALTDILSNKE